MKQLVKELKESADGKLLLILAAPPLAYLSYKLLLEAWCVAYGLIY